MQRREMRNLLLTCLFVSTCFSLISSNLNADEGKPGEGKRIELWNGHAPLGDGKTETAESWITIYQAAQPNGTAIVICPGGGYGGLAIEPEGHGIARWLNANGITGVVLQYRLPAGRNPIPLLDVQRAIRVVRSTAQEYHIRPDRIGVMGFSAGGHLASTALTHFDRGNSSATDAVDRSSCRPDFGILVYPVISMGEKTHHGSRNNLLGKIPSEKLIETYSNEKQVNSETPPTFLAHPVDDTVVVVANSQMFYDAMVAHKVPGKLLLLPYGGHGLNGYKGPMWDEWQQKSLAWLQEIQMTPPSTR